MKFELGLWLWKRREEIIGSNLRNSDYFEMKLKLLLFLGLWSNVICLVGFFFFGNVIFFR